MSNRRAIGNLLHSFSFKLALLALILLSVPLILYRQFTEAEYDQERLLANAIDQTNRVTAALLRPHLEKFSKEPASMLHDALARAAGRHMKHLRAQ